MGLGCDSLLLYVLASLIFRYIPLSYNRESHYVYTLSTTLNMQVLARTTEVYGDVVVIMPTNHMHSRCRNDSMQARQTRVYKKTSYPPPPNIG